MEPVSVKSLIVKKSLLPNSEVFCSLDRGCSLTKLLYKKSIPEDADSVSLQMAFYLNADFEKAIDWLIDRIAEEGAKGQKIHLTGVGGDKYRFDIEEKTGLKAEYIDEFASQNAGCHFLVSNFDDNEFCYEEDPPMQMEESMKPPAWVLKMIEKEAARYKENMNKRMPAVFAFCGSATAFNVLHENKSMEIVCGSMFGGKSMLGMSKLIVGTNDYDQLMQLAEKGSLKNIDTLSGDVIAQHEDSEFKLMPPDLPLMPLGKASESGAGDFATEDKAAGIVNAICTSLMSQLVAACKLTRVPKVYIGGHLFRAAVARRTFSMASFMNFSSFSILKIRFLSNGHTGCIGAMVLTKEEAENRRDNIKVE